MIGACMIVAPADLAASTTRSVFASMPVFSITASTAPCSTPPSDVKSFWYSMRTTAVLAGSIDIGNLLGLARRRDVLTGAAGANLMVVRARQSPPVAWIPARRPRSSAPVAVLVLLPRPARAGLIPAHLSLGRSVAGMAGGVAVAVHATRPFCRGLDDVAHDRLRDERGRDAGTGSPGQSAAPEPCCRARRGHLRSVDRAARSIRPGRRRSRGLGGAGRWHGDARLSGCRSEE